ncbi:MAG TPA: hypothetical protein VIV12_29025 [Streptosporangiaceae bacterium]
MGLFDRTAKRLADGPTLIMAADPGDTVAELLLAYDPAMRAQGGRFVLGNGVRLCGPVELTPDLTQQAGLPVSMTAAYYADVVKARPRGSRPGQAKWQDAELLVRGLAQRLGATVHDARPPMKVNLAASVYSAQPIPVAEVISLLQPFTDDELFVQEDDDVPDAYFLVSEQEPRFLTVYWPRRLSRSPLAQPPPALGSLRDEAPCRWELGTKFPVADADREIRLTVGEAALALANRVAGIVIDPYGFPVTRAEDLLPRR